MSDHFGPCCIPGCKDAYDDTCRMGNPEGSPDSWVLCYPHAAQLYSVLEGRSEAPWETRLATMRTWVQERGGMTAPTQLKPRTAGGFR